MTFLLWLLAIAAPVHADESAQPSRFRNWALSWENDILLAGEAQDRWYTNGLHWTGTYRRDRIPDALSPTLLFGDAVLGGPSELTLSFGQNIYTPQAFGLRAPQLYDRPFAGFLYSGLGWSRYAGRSHHAIEARFGIIGPASGAAAVQRVAHQWFGAREPLGWPNQLRPMLGAQVGYRLTQRWQPPGPVAINTNFGGVLGNTRTYASLGLGLVLGDRALPMPADNQGDFTITDFSGTASGARSRQGRFLGFLHIENAYVFSNRFITGSTFGTQPSIDLRHDVLTLSAGVLMRWDQHWRLGFVFKRMSPEFRLPGNTPSVQFQNWGGFVIIREM